MFEQIGGMRPWPAAQSRRNMRGPRPISGFGGQFSGSMPGALSERELKQAEAATDAVLSAVGSGDLVTPDELRRLDRSPRPSIEGDPAIGETNSKGGRPWAPYGGTIEVPYREIDSSWSTRRLDPAAVVDVISADAHFEPDGAGGFTQIGGPTASRSGFASRSPVVVGSRGRVLANPDSTASWKTDYQLPLAEKVQQLMDDYKTPVVSMGVMNDPARWRPTSAAGGAAPGEPLGFVRVLTTAQAPGQVRDVPLAADTVVITGPSGRQVRRAPALQPGPARQMRETWLPAYQYSSRDGNEGLRLGSRLPRREGLLEELASTVSLGGRPIASVVQDPTAGVDVVQRAWRTNNRPDEAGRTAFVSRPQLEAAQQVGWQFEQPDSMGVIRGQRGDQSEFVLIPETVIGAGGVNTGTPTGRYILRSPDDFASAGMSGYGVGPLSPHAGTRKAAEQLGGISTYDLMDELQAHVGAEPDSAPPLAVGRALREALTDPATGAVVRPELVTGSSATQLAYVRQLIADAEARGMAPSVQLPLPNTVSTKTGRAIDWIRKAGLRRDAPFPAAPAEAAYASSLRGEAGGLTPQADGQLEIPGVLLGRADGTRPTKEATDRAVARMNEDEFWRGVTDVTGDVKDAYNAGFSVIDASDGEPLAQDLGLMARIAQRQFGLRDPRHAAYVAEQAMLNASQSAWSEGRLPTNSDNVRALMNLVAQPVTTTRTHWPEGAVSPTPVPPRASVLMPVGLPGIREVGYGMEPYLVQSASPRESMPREWRAPLVRGARANPPRETWPLQ
jgi:hypothetical protein